jgi:hypothetical protein
VHESCINVHMNKKNHLFLLLSFFLINIHFSNACLDGCCNKQIVQDFFSFKEQFDKVVPVNSDIGSAFQGVPTSQFMKRSNSENNNSVDSNRSEFSKDSRNRSRYEENFRESTNFSFRDCNDTAKLFEKKNQDNRKPSLTEINQSKLDVTNKNNDKALFFKTSVNKIKSTTNLLRMSRVKHKGETESKLRVSMNTKVKVKVQEKDFEKLKSLEHAFNKKFNSRAIILTSGHGEDRKIFYYLENALKYEDGTLVEEPLHSKLNDKKKFREAKRIITNEKYEQVEVNLDFRDKNGKKFFLYKDTNELN